MEIKVADIYIRHSDRQICKVKRVDHKMVVLEWEDESRLVLTDIFGLEKAYSKRESELTQKSP